MPRAPRTEPYVRLSRIRLPPRFQTTHRCRGAAYARQRLCHTNPVLSPVCALLVRISLGLGPSLHRLRLGLLHAVRRLHRYYGLVRLPASVHHRLRLLAFPMRTLGHCAIGQMQDLPVSDTLLLRVMCSSTSAGRQHLAKRCCSCCVRLQRKASAPTRRVFRGSITHPTQLLCTLRGRRYRRSRNTRYQAARYALPGLDFHQRIAPASWRTLCPPYSYVSGNMSTILRLIGSMISTCCLNLR